MKKVTHKKNENLNTLESRLIDVRTRKGISQQELATKTHLTRQHINYFETGSRVPDIDKLKSIADVLDVSLDYLLCRTNNFSISNTNISQKTGLSDKSISKLNKFTIKDGWQLDTIYGERYNYQDYFIIINKLIENDKFEELIHYIRAYINSFKIQQLENEIRDRGLEDIGVYSENFENIYNVSKSDIYKFSINDLFNMIINDEVSQLKDSFSDRWVLNEDKTKVMRKCKDSSEAIPLLKSFGGVKDNGSSRNNKK